MKLVLNPEFSSFKNFVISLPRQFDKEGETIYKARNEIKVFNVEGTLLNVKKYKIPITINKIIYGFIRQPKAQRAYNNALKVIAAGIETPAPVAYMLRKKSGLLYESYFVSVQSSYPRKFTEFAEKKDLSNDIEVIKALGKYVAEMHEKNILHLDLSVGNVLFQVDAEGTHFSIVDLNRMQFRPIGKDLGCKNFERLRGTSEFFTIIAQAYAEARGFDVKECTELILKYNAEHVEKFIRHREFKKRIRRKK